MPEVSIIVPIYNVEKYLNRCIDSILEQTFKNFELILVDDGSLDGSGKICDEYANRDNRIKVIHKRNAGVSAARNTGIDAAIGKYIMFVDSDDYVKENMLQIMISVMEQGFDMIFTEIEMVTLTGIQYFSMEKKVYNPKQLIEAYCIGSFPIINICGPWAKLYKTSIIKENNIYFNTKLHYGEDTYFNFTYLRSCRMIMALNKAFYVYMRDNNESLFSKVREYAYHNECEVFLLIKGLAQEYKCTNAAIDKLTEKHIFGNISLINKAIMTSEKSVCIRLMKEMSESELFLENIIKLRKKSTFYLIALLIKNRCFNIAYYICMVWRKIRGYSNGSR